MFYLNSILFSLNIPIFNLYIHRAKAPVAAAKAADPEDSEEDDEDDIAEFVPIAKSTG